MLASLVKNIPDGAVTQVHNVVEVFLTSILLKNLLLRIKPKELLLNFCQLCDVVLKLVLVQLVQVVLTQDHMLDQLGNFLVEFYHVWSPMDEILN